MRNEPLIALAIILLSTNAEARVGRGGSALPVSTPVLQSVSVPFGQSTQTSRGGVRLSSMDQTTTAVQPQTFSGIDLQSPAAPACTSWTIAFVSNSAGRPSTDFTLPVAGVAEGSAAITPIPSSTGVGHIAGDYVWNVSCTANSQSSNTVQLTYNTTANTVTIGTTEALNVTYYPSGFGNVAGAKITAAVGMDRHTGGFVPGIGNFTNTVTITPADTARRPYLAQVGVSAGSGTPGNVTISDWVLSGPLVGSPTNSVVGISTTAAGVVHDIVFDNIKYYASEPMVTQLSVGLGGGVGWLFTNGGSCGSNCVVQNSEFNYLESGVAPATNTALRNVSFRYVYNNCIFINGVSNFELSDVKCLAPMQRLFGAHPDMIQISDESVPGPGILIQRFMGHQADGDYFAQGPIFSNSNPVPGYVDDGTGAHGPGNIFTKTSGVFSSNKNNGLIVISGFISSSAGVHMSCIGTCSTATQVTLVGLSPTNIGSSGSPVDLYGAAINNLQMSGVMSSQAGPYGISLGGNAGTSWLYDYDYISMDAQNPAIGTFTGSINAGVLTTTTAPVSNIPGQTAWIQNTAAGNMGRLNYPGCNYGSSCGGITGTISGGSIGPGTYSVPGGINTASGTMQISGAYAGQSNPAFMPFHCAEPGVWGGTFNVDRGWFQTGYFPRYDCTINVDFPPASVTVGANAFGPPGPSFNPKYTPAAGDLSAADFASGMLPTAYLAAHSFTAADTPADILRINCLALKGKIGGKRDLGSGAWAGSVTGETNAGTHTGGGDWIIYNGSAHVASTHISGCELAP